MFRLYFNSVKVNTCGLWARSRGINLFIPISCLKAECYFRVPYKLNARTKVKVYDGVMLNHKIIPDLMWWRVKTYVDRVNSP